MLRWHVWRVLLLLRVAPCSRILLAVVLLILGLLTLIGLLSGLAATQSRECILGEALWVVSHVAPTLEAGS